MGIINTESRMENLYAPATKYKDTLTIVQSLLKGFDYGVPETQMSKLLIQYIVRREAGSINMFIDNYNYTLEELENMYTLKDIRKCFSCVFINILEYLNFSSGSYMLNENSFGILDENGKAILPSND